MRILSFAAKALTGAFLLVAAAAPVRAADIVDTAIEAGQFNTLATALTEAELVEALRGDGPFTVFAPNDEAFAKLDPAVLEDLLKPENKEKLQAILTYHVVSGKVMAADVVGKYQKVKTLNGKKIKVNGKGDGVTVNDANVIATDIEADNGVIHVIDTVLLPPKDKKKSY